MKQPAVIRAIVFQEGDAYIAQCLEHDICVQSPTIPALLDRLHLTVEAEFATCRDAGQGSLGAIRPAPNNFAALWDRRAVTLSRIGSFAPDHRADGFLLDVAMADVARVAA